MTDCEYHHAALLLKYSRQSDNHYLYVADARTEICYDCVVDFVPNPLSFGAAFALAWYFASCHIVACPLAVVAQIGLADLTRLCGLLAIGSSISSAAQNFHGHCLAGQLKSDAWTQPWLQLSTRPWGPTGNKLHRLPLTLSG